MHILHAILSLITTAPSSPSNSLNHLLLPSDRGISTPFNVPTDTRNDTSCFTRSNQYAYSNNRDGNIIQSHLFRKTGKKDQYVRLYLSDVRKGIKLCFCGPNTAKAWGWWSDAPSMMLEHAVKTWHRVWKCPAGDHFLVDFLSSLVGIKVLYNVRVWHLFYRPISRLFRILVIWSLGNNNVPHKDNTAVQTKTK